MNFIRSRPTHPTIVSYNVECNFKCLHLTLGEHDGLGLLLVYWSPHRPTVSLLAPSDLALNMLLESPRLMVLGDWNVHAWASRDRAAQDSVTCVTTRAVCPQLISDPTHHGGTCGIWCLVLVRVTMIRKWGICDSFPCHSETAFCFRLTGASNLHVGGGNCWARSWRLMDLNGLLSFLRFFPGDMVGESVEALNFLWDREVWTGCRHNRS